MGSFFLLSPVRNTFPKPAPTASRLRKSAAIAISDECKPRMQRVSRSGQDTAVYGGRAVSQGHSRRSRYEHPFKAGAEWKAEGELQRLSHGRRRHDDMLPAENPKSTVNRSTIAETCGRCHGDKSVMQGSGISDRPILAYQESVHAKALSRGNPNAAVCTDCHTSHNVQPASNPESSIAKINIPATCGKCHNDEAKQFVESVHGLAVTRGVSRSPACTDCHGIHDIQNPIDQNTDRATAAVATDSCAQCHEGVALTQEFGVASGRVASYKDSYHGMASKLGSKVVANCASCHGVHNILPSSDPRSMISAAESCTNVRPMPYRRRD